MKKIRDYRITPHLNQLLTKIEKFHGAFELGHKLNPKLVTRLKKTTLITSSGASTRIEGAVLSDSEVEEFLEKGCKISKMSSRSEREVGGYIKALNYVYENYPDLEVSEKNIRELHQILTSKLTQSELPKKQRGAYKDVPNHVVEKNLETGKETVWFKTTPPGPQTLSAMRNLIQDFHQVEKEGKLHYLLLVATFIVHFLAIHPFRDGNGRLSRIITIWLMLKYGYIWFQYTSHEKVIEDNKERYYLSLRKTQRSFQTKNHKYDEWLSYFAETVYKQTEILKVFMDKESPVTVMNKNEKDVYEILKRHGVCNIGFILENTPMTRGGLKTLLKRMVDRGYIKFRGQGKGRVYFL